MNSKEKSTGRMNRINSKGKRRTTIRWRKKDQDLCMIHDIPHLKNTTEKEIFETWFTADEYREIKQDFEYTLFMMSLGKPEKVNDDIDNTIRGLEIRSEEGGWDRYVHKRDSYNAVLDEVDLQVEKTPVCHETERGRKKIQWNFDSLSEASLAATIEAREQAHERGKADYESIRSDIVQEDTPEVIKTDGEDFEDVQEETPEIIKTGDINVQEGAQNIIRTDENDFENPSDLDRFSEEEKVGIKSSSSGIPHLKADIVEEPQKVQLQQQQGEPKVISCDSGKSVSCQKDDDGSDEASQSSGSLSPSVTTGDKSQHVPVTCERTVEQEQQKQQEDFQEDRDERKDSKNKEAVGEEAKVEATVALEDIEDETSCSSKEEEQQWSLLPKGLKVVEKSPSSVAGLSDSVSTLGWWSAMKESSEHSRSSIILLSSAVLETSSSSSSSESSFASSSSSLEVSSISPEEPRETNIILLLTGKQSEKPAEKTVEELTSQRQHRGPQGAETILSDAPSDSSNAKGDNSDHDENNIDYDPTLGPESVIQVMNIIYDSDDDPIAGIESVKCSMNVGGADNDDDDDEDDYDPITGAGSVLGTLEKPTMETYPGESSDKASRFLSMEHFSNSNDDNDDEGESDIDSTVMIERVPISCINKRRVLPGRITFSKHLDEDSIVGNTKRVAAAKLNLVDDDFDDDSTFTTQTTLSSSSKIDEDEGNAAASKLRTTRRASLNLMLLSSNDDEEDDDYCFSGTTRRASLQCMLPSRKQEIYKKHAVLHSSLDSMFQPEQEAGDEDFCNDQGKDSLLGGVWRPPTTSSASKMLGGSCSGDATVGSIPQSVTVSTQPIIGSSTLERMWQTKSSDDDDYYTDDDDDDESVLDCPGVSSMFLMAPKMKLTDSYGTRTTHSSSFKSVEREGTNTRNPAMNSSTKKEAEEAVVVLPNSKNVSSLRQAEKRMETSSSSPQEVSATSLKKALSESKKKKACPASSSYTTPSSSSRRKAVFQRSNTTRSPPRTKNESHEEVTGSSLKMELVQSRRKTFPKLMESATTSSAPLSLRETASISGRRRSRVAKSSSYASHSRTTIEGEGRERDASQSSTISSPRNRRGGSRDSSMKRDSFLSQEDGSDEGDEIRVSLSQNRKKRFERNSIARVSRPIIMSKGGRNRQQSVQSSRWVAPPSSRSFSSRGNRDAHGESSSISSNNKNGHNHRDHHYHKEKPDWGRKVVVPHPRRTTSPPTIGGKASQRATVVGTRSSGRRM